MGGGGDLTYQLDILLVFGEYRRKETLKLVSEFKAKRIILPFSLRTLLKKIMTMSFIISGTSTEKCGVACSL